MYLKIQSLYIYHSTYEVTPKLSTWVQWVCESLRKAHFGENEGIEPLCTAQFSSVLNATENENKAAPLSGLRALSLLSYTQQTETTRLTTVIYMWFLKWTWEFIPLLSCTCMCGLYVVYAHSGKPEDTSLLLSLSPLPNPSRPGLTLKPELSWQPGRPSNITEAGHLSQYWVKANTTTSSSLYAF